MDKFRAYQLTETPDRKMRAEFVERSLDELDPGEVVVRVANSDINYKDALAATGKGKILRRASCIGGIDFSGTVVSSGDPRFARGDAVLAVGYDLGVAHDGGYAEYARVPAEWLTKLPRECRCGTRWRSAPPASPPASPSCAWSTTGSVRRAGR